jgi:hypothetical protein
MAVAAVEGRKNGVRLRRPPIAMMQSAQDPLRKARFLQRTLAAAGGAWYFALPQ